MLPLRAGRDLILLVVTFLRTGAKYVLPMGLLVRSIVYEKKKKAAIKQILALASAALECLRIILFTTLPQPSPLLLRHLQRSVVTLKFFHLAQTHSSSMRKTRHMAVP